jgi:hypothetical protein
MKFREITSRLTGISSPIFGVSWNPAPVVEELVDHYLEKLQQKGGSQP